MSKTVGVIFCAIEKNLISIFDKSLHYHIPYDLNLCKSESGYHTNENNKLIWLILFVFNCSSLQYLLKYRSGSFIYRRLNPHYTWDCISERNM